MYALWNICNTFPWQCTEREALGAEALPSHLLNVTDCEFWQLKCDVSVEVYIVLANKFEFAYEEIVCVFSPRAVTVRRHEVVLSEQNGLRTNVLLLVQTDMRYLCSDQVYPQAALFYQHLITRGRCSRQCPSARVYQATGNHHPSSPENHPLAQNPAICRTCQASDAVDNKTLCTFDTYPTSLSPFPAQQST